jgi:hypothetical protein
MIEYGPMSRTRRVFSFALLAAVSLASLLAGCQQSSVTQSRVSTTVQGREVVATVDGPAFISGSMSGDAVVTLGAKKIVVEKGRVLIDGAEKASIPTETRKVEIDVSHGIMTIKSDSKQVYKSAP